MDPIFSFLHRLEVKKGPATRLLLMTTGVLLRMLQMGEGNLDGISHIFVDEVHERDINTDFLLIILKKLLKQRPDLKVIDCLSRLGHFIHTQ